MGCSLPFPLLSLSLSRSRACACTSGRASRPACTGPSTVDSSWASCRKGVGSFDFVREIFLDGALPILGRGTGGEERRASWGEKGEGKGTRGYCREKESAVAGLTEKGGGMPVGEAVSSEGGWVLLGPRRAPARSTTINRATTPASN